MSLHNMSRFIGQLQGRQMSYSRKSRPSRLQLKKKGVRGILLVGALVGGAAVSYSVIHQLRNSLSVVTDVFETEKKYNSYIYVQDEPEDVTKAKRRRRFKLPFRFKKPWFPYMQSRSDDPWTLLKLAQSDDRNVRLLGVKALAEEHHWTDAEFQMLAQTIDFRTLVGLSRIEDVNPKFFLPPPRIAPTELNLEDELRNLLSSLPLDSIDKCTQYFTSSALQSESRAMSEERGGAWCFGGTGLAFASSLAQVPEEIVIAFCLQAIMMHTRSTYWEVVQNGEFYKVRYEPAKQQIEMLQLQAFLGQSEVPSHCPEFVQGGGLKVLRQLYERRRSSIKIVRAIARILSNLALQQSLHTDIIRGGWVTILQHWLTSPDLALSLHAAKALANLDRDFGGSRLYPDGVYLYHPQYRYSEPVYADIVFVHGLLGGPFRTWRQRDIGQRTRKSTNPAQEQNIKLPPQTTEQNQKTTTQILEQNKKTAPQIQAPSSKAENTTSDATRETETSNLNNRSNSPSSTTDSVVAKKVVHHEPYTFCWPKDWLAVDVPNTRIITVEYETHLSEWAPKCPYESEKRSLSARSGELLDKLRLSGLGQRPIIWVAHSMGGLLVKQMLLEAQEDEQFSGIVDQTKGIIFYSVPHHGSPLAGYTNHTKFLLYPSVEVKELMQGSSQLSELHQKFKQQMFNTGIPLLSFAEGQKTELPLNLMMVIVPPESSDPGFGEFHYMEELNHLNICKPAHKGEPLYQISLDFIRDCLPLHLVDKIIKANLPEEYVIPEVIDKR